jgi:hypothetical protein
MTVFVFAFTLVSAIESPFNGQRTEEPEFPRYLRRVESAAAIVNRIFLRKSALFARFLEIPCFFPGKGRFEARKALGRAIIS